MRVAKWGNGLAVRLPAALVEALGLHEGDDIEIILDDNVSLLYTRKRGRKHHWRNYGRFVASCQLISGSLEMMRMCGIKHRGFLDSNMVLYRVDDTHGYKDVEQVF